jgi:hypothetical protein
VRHEQRGAELRRVDRGVFKIGNLIRLAAEHAALLASAVSVWPGTATPNPPTAPGVNTTPANTAVDTTQMRARTIVRSCEVDLGGR